MRRAAYKSVPRLSARQPRAARRHCRRRPVLELAAHAFRRPVALLASLAPSEAHAFAYCRPFRPLAGIPRAAVATAAGRR
jgi:hypothetical protein